MFRNGKSIRRQCSIYIRSSQCVRSTLTPKQSELLSNNVRSIRKRRRRTFPVIPTTYTSKSILILNGTRDTILCSSFFFSFCLIFLSTFLFFVFVFLLLSLISRSNVFSRKKIEKRKKQKEKITTQILLVKRSIIRTISLFLFRVR